MKDYYEILEVNKHASKEIIDKAYKVLAKKYHPDLQDEENKKKAVAKMQEINEAYEVLSDETKRKEYDEQVEEIEKSKIQNTNNSYSNNNSYETQKENTDNSQANYTQKKYTRIPYTPEELKARMKAQEELEKERRKRIIEEEQRQYRSYLRSLGYKVKEKWTWKRFLKLLEAIGIIILVLIILWFFPPTHKLLLETYEGNDFIRAIVDIIGKIFTGIGNGIGAFFRGIAGR